MIDISVIGIAFSCFFFFLFLHVVLLRAPNNWPASKVIFFSMFISILLNAGVYGYFAVTQLLPAGFSALSSVFCGLLSVFLCGFLIFHYLLWIFGMGEAAIRIRILFELSRHPAGGATLDEIYDRYNAEKILDARLQRLVGAGHLRASGDIFSMQNRVLLLQLAMNRFVERILGLPGRDPMGHHAIGSSAEKF